VAALFIDYDNDGWMDLFILSGTRLEGAPPGTTNRLYKNNRDGTFADVTEKAGLTAVGWASAVCVGDYNNDGFEDLFCTYFGQNRLYRNNGDGTFTDVTKASGLWTEQPRWARAAASSTTTATGIWTFSFPIMSASLSSTLLCPAKRQLQLEGNSGWSAGHGGAYGAPFALPQQRRWNVYRCQRAGWGRGRDGKVTA